MIIPFHPAPDLSVVKKISSSHPLAYRAADGLHELLRCRGEADVGLDEAYEAPCKRHVAESIITLHPRRAVPQQYHSVIEIHGLRQGCLEASVGGKTDCDQGSHPEVSTGCR